jgi:mutator protein MutT
MIIQVTAGLIFRGGKLLITQRPKGSHLAGLWEMPGGKQDPGETLPECLKRELREELGVEVEVHELLHECVHEYPLKTVKLHFFRCTLLRGEPRPIQCDSLAWVTAPELAQYEFPPPDASLLKSLRRGELLHFFQLQ